MARRERPRLRLLFDEDQPPGVARALNELGFRTSHVGHSGHGQPPRGSDDATVLRHAMSTGQIVVTSNHDMIMLCAELGESVVWIDPHGRQYLHDEMAGLCFDGIADWHNKLNAADGPVCVKALRTKVEVLSLERAATLAAKRMRRAGGRKPARRRRPEPMPGQIAADNQA